MKNNPYYYRIGQELIRKPKPFGCGDQVHILRWEGCYKVHEVCLDYFVILKNRVEVRIGWGEFLCLKGEGSSDIALAKRIVRSQLLETIRREEVLLHQLSRLKSI